MPKPIRKGKSRSRRSADLHRRGPGREPYDRILIVCEDTKSARLYFEEIRREWRLSPVNIGVRPSVYGTDPESVVRYARARFDEEGEDYDVVYCVFDRDQHATFGQALALVKTYNEGVSPRSIGGDGAIRARFRSIVSDPCFEFWLLLHYKYTDKPYISTGARSSCEDLVRDLKACIVDYRKGCSGMFARTASLLSTACDHARRRARRADADGTTNPGTEVHLLIEHLDELRRAVSSEL